MKITVVGVGYVGIHSVINLAKLGHEVYGFDISESKIEKYNNGIDVTDEVGNEEIANTIATFTCNQEDIKNSEIYIVAVPTDVNSLTKEIDLRPLQSASKTIGNVIGKDSIVIYESTVYPGLTEEICIPIIEENSGKKVSIDFDVVYTPERVDPGNKVNTVLNTPRIISGTSDKAVDKVISLYEKYITTMVKVSNIRTAESVKILENTQRDVNIALMNNFALLMDTLDISFDEVLNAAATKWNFINFTPGLVGGHCIGIDTNYLIAKMQMENLDTSFLKAVRNVNEDIIKYVYDKITEDYYAKKILYVGCTFKPNTNDIRNSKHLELIKELSLKYEVDIYDPIADYDCINDGNEINVDEYDVIVVGVVHNNESYSFLDNVSGEKKIINIANSVKFNENTWNLK